MGNTLRQRGHVVLDFNHDNRHTSWNTWLHFGILASIVEVLLRELLLGADMVVGDPSGLSDSSHRQIEQLLASSVVSGVISGFNPPTVVGNDDEDVAPPPLPVDVGQLKTSRLRSWSSGTPRGTGGPADAKKAVINDSMTA